MFLESLSLTEFPGQPGEWSIESFNLGRLNLVVGKNATGKTRLLNVISVLGKLLCGAEKEPRGAAKWHIVFKNDSNFWDYTLEHDTADIQREDLVYNGDTVIHRGAGGLGRIQANDVDEGNDPKPVRLRFRAPLRQIGVVAKRDAIQHPYLEPLHDWGDSLRHFQFGYEMRPHNLAIKVKLDGIKAVIDEKDTESLVPIFDLAVKKHGDQLIGIVLKDMAALGYPIRELTIKKPAHAVIAGVFAGELVGVSAQEEDLAVMTDQPAMSQGMFRSLSLLIQTTHYLLSSKTGCILVDDIGEGLDFERSCILIDILRDKAKNASFQLIMSTNNRFVMNRVPLEEWCVLQRKGGTIRVRNYANSAKAFEQFKVTGLNNFDLLATNYLEGK